LHAGLLCNTGDLTWTDFIVDAPPSWLDKRLANVDVAIGYMLSMIVIVNAPYFSR
jgi:hypothetical protein